MNDEDVFDDIIFDLNQLYDSLNDDLIDVINESESDNLSAERAAWLDERYCDITSRMQSVQYKLQAYKDRYLSQEE